MYTSTVNDQIFIEKKILKIKVGDDRYRTTKNTKTKSFEKSKLFLIYSNFQSIEVDLMDLSKRQRNLKLL